MARPLVTIPRLTHIVCRQALVPLRAIHTSPTLLRPAADPKDPADDPKQGGTGFLGVRSLHSQPLSFSFPPPGIRPATSFHSLLLTRTRHCFTARKKPKKKASSPPPQSNTRNSSGAGNTCMRKSPTPSFPPAATSTWTRPKRISGRWSSGAESWVG